MEKMKLNSKTDYNRSRVINGHGPHRILEMIQQELLDSISKNKTLEMR
jgi:hypothetical protein